MLRILFSFILAFIFLSTPASAEIKTAHGNAFQEVETLSDIPLAIRQKLGFEEKGANGVADKGQPFNSTDLLMGDLPMRRFLLAAKDGDTCLIALEHGGRGYIVQAYLYSSDGELRQEWILTARSKSLSEIIASIPGK